MSLSQQITDVLGSDDWLIVHDGHHLITADDLDRKSGWLGGHCKYPRLKHADCPGHRGKDRCICSCHEPTDSGGAG